MSDNETGKPWYKTPNPLQWGGIPPIPEEPAESPEYKAGFLSQLTFSWLTPLMVTGYKRQLDERDIWNVNPERGAVPLTQKLKVAFQRRGKAGSKRPLLDALYDTFKFEIWAGGIFCFIYSTLQVLTPFVLRFLIQFAVDAYNAKLLHQAAPPITHGIGLVIGVTAMVSIQSLANNHFHYQSLILGGQTRGVLNGMIYEKAMVISSRAKAGGAPDATTAGLNEKKSKKGDDQIGWTNGRIATLMSIDTSRIDSACDFAHLAWASPLACVIVLILLSINLTYSALPGFGLLVIGTPLLTIATKRVARRRKTINKTTDKRVSLTQEVIQSVRFVKFFGWEPAFLDRLEKLRTKEIRALQSLLSTRIGINSFSFSLPVFASTLAFVTYSLTRNNLEPARVFSSLALFNSLRIPLNLLHITLGETIDAWSSIERIEKFLLEEERDERTIWNPEGEYAIELRSTTFTWEKNRKQENHTEGKGVADAQGRNKQPKTPPEKVEAIEHHKAVSDDSATASFDEPEPFKLSDVSFKAGRNELIAVIGTVGSGKSSLLSALAGHMRRTDGDVILGASRAYCPQSAWIQNTSLQKNITFGKSLDQKRYKEIIEACALEPDLEVLPHGDQTEIGERGITISGGQKQRLNIARAIYSDADIVLMDDPLSAVDAYVGRHIFDNAILGLLKGKGKCIVLATHQLWVLDRCDRIVWLDNGRVQATGTFEDLMSYHTGFKSLIEATVTKAEDEHEAEDGVTKDTIDDIEDAPTPVDGIVGQKRDDPQPKPTPLIREEERAQYSVPWSTYAAYVRASGTILNAPLGIVLLILYQGSGIVTNLWLSFWVSNKFHYSIGLNIGVYIALGVTQTLLMFAFSTMVSILGTRASKAMFRRAITRVLHAPVSFFDTTPLGRIVNRFSSDVDLLDNRLAEAIKAFLITTSSAIAIFILTIAYFYYFVIALIPFYALYVGAASYYRASAREVKRYHSTLQSKVVAKFTEGLGGIASGTIQAYGLENQFVNDLLSSIDSMNAAYYLTFANQRWLTVRLDVLGNALIFIVGILVVTSRFSTNPSTSGLVLSYFLSVVQQLQLAIRQLADSDKGMNSVERLHYFGAKIEEEAPWHLTNANVSENWPESGEIIFRDVKMRYREGLPLVLRGLSIHVKAGERIGIVGRTGAGKSSITNALFRLVELYSGSITIDGVDISQIGLLDLRSRLTIIPQDPTLFRGTIRSNLDPFHQHTDMELWSALRQTGLVRTDARPGDEIEGSGCRIHLDGTVEEDGANFSLGQRQLVALTRALVRDSRIIVCDEATSSIDVETDDKIQLTMAACFRRKTVLCIAHRLRTIIGYDRICVLDSGQIAELDTPANLFQSESGIFRGMCERSGIQLEDIELAGDAMAAFR